MRDDELNTRLESYRAPEPGELLKARILKAAAAEAAPPVSRTWGRYAVAACLLAILAIGFGGLQLLQPAASSDDIWLEAAGDLGVSEIYEWVEGEDSQ